MKKEIYIYLLLFVAIGTSIYLEVRQIVNLDNLTENSTFTQFIDTRQNEVSDFISLKSNSISNSNTAELVFGIAVELKSSNIFVNIACKWIDDKSLELPIPFTFAQKLHYEFKVCGNFQYCACNDAIESNEGNIENRLAVLQ
jgi:hypothetical protein